MNDAIDPVQRTVDDLYKTHYGKIVSVLLTNFPDIPLESVEDAVHDAFAAALTAWAAGTHPASTIPSNPIPSNSISSNSIPSNPPGWIYTVCRNKMINLLREGQRLRPLPDQHAGVEPNFDGPSSTFKDQQLNLLFSCAHPDLSPKVQVVITLKYVANLKTAAIAQALGMTEDGIDKLLFRAKKKIREEKLFLLDPGGLTGLHHRLPTVHKIIYLIFNEGYKPSSGDEAVNEAMCEEALLLCKDILDLGHGDTATRALYALMLFNAARFGGRLSPSGELLDLDEQDRSLWNRPMIVLAGDFLRQSRSTHLSSYHYEAGIAWLHCSADSFAGTNWRLISRLYLRLLRMNPNPFVELNYAIALYYAGGKAKAFEILEGLLHQPFMNGYYLLNAALGKLYMLEGDAARAKQFFARTLEQTTHPLEVAFIHRLSPP